ncbi:MULTISPECIES: SAM-dependent methyltransferase [unclassified Pseudomonas]|uniref:SAM-dependent methyltransferase n=1 Tax=unclassified Pseudomonas TaxID=196821 RepID=UPI000C86CC33|nr:MULTISPECIES: SAM-dependent methyltransferase [unclassified Pseudomonas]PMV88563.1 SAM-dependent methyltransferase [Pseudomonas sp. GW101-1A09]PMV89670.1 SAM-dependent methyltransferase [Pseudomonas sp. FW306-2-2C-B10A]PMV92102.1 SAM-dependent methyltransferase [Pseudomonas sp. GW460-C8]PMW06439.1 SAM-dependent methyltransferase [Pseudomonas sp. MPR-TSA4]PMW14255.1 SAM-dependent methyltransferase [Pseudomonas sp. GW456-11-11-14-TSB2]
MSVDDRYFDGLFTGNDDPWSFRQRWYEQRKRAITLAAMPRPHYRAIFEPGCANGELSFELASRCDRLLCCDTAAAAVTLARTRLGPFDHAEVRHSRLPADWPDEKFDLIVLSEVGYYLDADDLKRLIEQAAQSLTADGQLLACHWRPPIDDCPLNARQVHDLLHEHLHLPRLALHQEADFLLELWSREPRSVAALEGLR